MISAAIEIAAFASIVTGVDMLAGGPWAFITAGIFAIVVALGIEDTALNRVLLGGLTAPVRAVRAARRRRRRHDHDVVASPHPELRIDQVDEDFARWAAQSASRRAGGNLPDDD